MGEPAVILATKPSALPRPSRTFPTGRVCAAGGCETQLSIYNAESRCWIHNSAYPQRIRSDAWESDVRRPHGSKGMR